jgi:hypothetical protein
MRTCRFGRDTTNATILFAPAASDRVFRFVEKNRSSPYSGSAVS